MQREPNVQRSIEQVRSELMNNANRQYRLTYNKSLKRSANLIQSGREGARTQLIQSLVNVEKTLSVMEQKQVQQNQTLATPQLTEEQIRPTGSIKEMVANCSKEVDFPKALNEVKSQTEKAPFEQQTKELLTKSLQEATSLHEQGRELAARQQLLQAFTTVEPHVASRETSN
ncbi:hypothetical protein KHA80_02485 [Anaerobacillus sp. HL2]|nr:hypothetical protein KHA80_02485 [Anaerobacillus sp. HL2]